MTLDKLITAAAAQLGVSDLSNLGRGGQKAVLKGRRAAGDYVAVKVIELGADAVALKRARREVELLASIDSDYVVRVESQPVELGKPAIGIAWLEELLPGKDLTESLLAGPWKWADARELARCLGSGLQAFHALQVVHRDLSPGNVRRLARDHYKIIDPGFARHIGKSSLTGLFQPGTLNFMSPEHVTPPTKPIPASDIFTAGILLYAALTKSAPIEFTGDGPDYISRLQQSKHVPLEKIRPDLPAEACDFVERCLHAQGARRFLDGAEFLAGLPS